MPDLTPADPEDCWCDDLARVDDLVDAGVVYRTVRRRIRVGSWQEPLRGVVCRTTGVLSHRQWLRAALLYAGPDSSISHASAVTLWGIPLESDRIVVTCAHGHHPPSTSEVWVRQSRRPYQRLPLEGLRVTGASRSVLDAGLDLVRLRDVDDLFGRAVQRRLTTVDQLAEELLDAPSGGSRLPRQSLAALSEGSHAASEAQLVRLITRAGLPAPEMNGLVQTARGIRYVDALWRALGKGVEVDGQAFHLSPEAWAADLARQNDIQSTGIVLLRIAARRLWTEPDAVIREIRWFLGMAAPTTAA
jgi:hypothetical protein